MVTRVVPVQADEDLVGDVLRRAEDARLHAVEGCAVDDVTGLEVDRVQPPVLVPGAVLQVQDVPPVERPQVLEDPADAIVRDGLRVVRAERVRPRRS